MARSEVSDNRAPDGQAFHEFVDARMIGVMRLILALTALAAVLIDPTESDRFITLTYGALILYNIYSAALCFLSLRQTSIPLERFTPWIDVGCYCVLIALNGGAGSIFFLFLFFAILQASFRWGAKSGMQMTTASALLFILIGLVIASYGADFELNRFLMRPVYLLVLGYMVAYWGGAEIVLKRRLKLLKDVSTLSNPRFGIGHTLFSFMGRLRRHYDADACVLLLCDRGISKYRMSRIGRGDSEKDMKAEKIPEELAHQFLALPEALAVVYNARPRLWQARGLRYYAFDVLRSVRTSEGLAASRTLAATLDAESFISLPLFYKGKEAGRLYLTGRAGKFEQSDVGFLLQIIEQVTRVLENIRLLDQLASGAAEQERQRIARDLHDTVIQPYIGLQYKVAAIRNKLAAGDDAAGDVEKLFDVTVNEITGLRDYVRELKDTKDGREGFLAALHRYTKQFQENYGIAVEVEVNTDLRLNDRLTAELIQMAHEGLCNVRKHTESATSRIIFESSNGHLVMSIENESPPHTDTAPETFIPVSVTERAENLGGWARVERPKEGRTVVKVGIPL